jgi:hypothetical protein
MTVDAAGMQAWASENRAAWEIAPLYEMHKGERLQVGFELELYARIPGGTPPDDRLEAIWERLREVAESLLPLAGEKARIEVDPFEATGRLRPETNFAPEVLLQARLFHASDYFAPVQEADRGQIKPIETRLCELGLRRRCW